jgi:AmmeMemoRadiSam system protein B
MTPSPQFPRLRPLELKWIDDGKQRVLLLRDPAGIAPNPATVPAWVAYLLSLCDGKRDASALRAAFELRTGQAISMKRVEELLGQLDEALFLDTPHFHAAQRHLLDQYRSSPFRRPALADQVYPADADKLSKELAAYRPTGQMSPASPGVRAVISPHIDYQRGGPVYAETWDRAAAAVQAAEIVVVFGTDHAGAPGKLTLTRQSYATPLGVLPSAPDVVDRLAQAIGEDDAFEEELHHRREHSIELAAVWLHLMSGSPPPAVIPVLCGSFYRFTEGETDPAAFETFERALAALGEATAGRRVLLVAAADLAHVGPAFGDPQPYGADDRAHLAEKDARLLEAICAGDAAEFFGQLREERDARRICGLPPIYLTLRFLAGARGEVVSYDQCPADAAGGSLVSIAGVLLS